MAGAHFGSPIWAILDDRKSLSIAFLAISDQYTTLIFFTKWLPAAILDDRKSLWIAFLAISDQYATSFFHKMAAGRHFGWLKSLLIEFLAISDQYATFFFTKWLPAAILDDRKSLSIKFLAISDQYETSFFHKMAAGGHFGWPNITFDRITRHFRSIRNFFFWFFFSKWPPAAILEVRFGPFWMIENHFRSHFSPFQINTQLCFWFFFQNGRWRPFWMSDLRQ